MLPRGKFTLATKCKRRMLALSVRILASRTVTDLARSLFHTVTEFTMLTQQTKEKLALSFTVYIPSTIFTVQFLINGQDSLPQILAHTINSTPLFLPDILSFRFQRWRLWPSPPPSTFVSGQPHLKNHTFFLPNPYNPLKYQERPHLF